MTGERGDPEYFKVESRLGERSVVGSCSLTSELLDTELISYLHVSIIDVVHLLSLIKCR